MVVLLRYGFCPSLLFDPSILPFDVVIEMNRYVEFVFDQNAWPYAYAGEVRQAFMPHIKDVSLEISREVSQFLFEVRLTVYYFMEFIELTSHSQPTSK